MNMQSQNGITVSSGDGKVYINGEDIKLPKNMKTNSQTTINGTVYIGGYEYFPKEKRFKRTLKSIFWGIF